MAISKTQTVTEWFWWSVGSSVFVGSLGGCEGSKPTTSLEGQLALTTLARIIALQGHYNWHLVGSYLLSIARLMSGSWLQLAGWIANWLAASDAISNPPSKPDPKNKPRANSKCIQTLLKLQIPSKIPSKITKPGPSQIQDTSKPHPNPQPLFHLHSLAPPRQGLPERRELRHRLARRAQSEAPGTGPMAENMGQLLKSWHRNLGFGRNATTWDRSPQKKAVATSAPRTSRLVPLRA